MNFSGLASVICRSSKYSRPRGDRQSPRNKLWSRETGAAARCKDEGGRMKDEFLRPCVCHLSSVIWHLSFFKILQTSRRSTITPQQTLVAGSGCSGTLPRETGAAARCKDEGGRMNHPKPYAHHQKASRQCPQLSRHAAEGSAMRCAAPESG